MTTLHPHWQETASAQPEKHAAPAAAKSVSRRPAAIVGITLVLFIGAGFVGGVDYLTAELVDEISVTIGLDGKAMPADIKTETGNEIAWTNATGAPVVLKSDTLCDFEGICMYVTLFPDSTERYAVPIEMSSGTFPYYDAVNGSPDKPLGKITVLSLLQAPPVRPPSSASAASSASTASENIPPAPIPSSTTTVEDPEQPDISAESSSSTSEITIATSEASSATSTTSGPQILTGVTSSANTSAAASSVESASTVPAELPRNPYTVGSNYGQTLTKPAAPATPLHGGAPIVNMHKPFRQPETGTASSMLVCIGAAAMYLLYRGIRNSASIRVGTL